MNTITARIRRLYRAALNRLRVWGWKKNTAGAAVLAVAVFGLVHFLSAAPAAEQQQSAVRQVEVKTVAELSSNQPKLSIVGSVESKSEATVRAEKSGQITSVNRALGDSVAAGTIVASIENASENASVLQAQGAVDAAEASLAKISGGSRDEQKAILQASLETAQSGYASAQSNAVNTLLSAYAAVDSGVRGTGDSMFSNPDSTNPQFNITNPDSQLTVSINNARLSMGPILDREASQAKALGTYADLPTEIDKTENEVRDVRNFFDQILRALNAAIPAGTVSSATIAADQASANAARTALTGALSSLAAAKENLNAKNQAITIAQQNLQQGVTGGQPEDVRAGQAALKQAQGGLAAARAALEKSYIRAPISGTINSFSLKRGDFVSASTPVLTVANNGALEIVAYLTENDAKDVSVGSKVSIEGGATGVITRIAPALDPVTKKIEVRIGVSSGASTLINGQSVVVSVARNNPVIAHADKVTIPIAAIKLGADQTVVFTVDENSKLVAHAVTLGALLGDRVVVTDGISEEMRIVTDARGLREGQTVTTQ